MKKTLSHTIFTIVMETYHAYIYRELKTITLTQTHNERI